MRLFSVGVLVFMLVFSVVVAHAQSQMEMTNTACEGAKKADAELNAVYSAIMKKHKNNKILIKKLKVAQRAWIAFRDAELSARYPGKASDYGSSYSMCSCIALEELTKKRTAELLPWRDGVEGDICSGSYFSE